MRYLHITLLFVAIGLASCNNTPGSENENKAVATASLPVQSKLNEAGTKKLADVITDYYGLKNAFVATKAPQVDSSAAKLLNSANTLISYLKTDSSNGGALKPYLDTIATETQDLIATKDETCEKQRLPFSKVSDMMFTLLKNAGVKNAVIYQEHCPMAFDGKGANWLSDDADIKNPYFGKKMLECGEVTDSIK